MAIDLSSIGNTKHAAPPRILLHGGEKVGKSSFFANAPAPIFIQTEDGLAGIDAQAFPLAKTYQDVDEALTALCSQDHEYQTVIIDSADWLEKLIHAEICARENVTSIEKAAGGYGKGYLEANNLWRDVLFKLDYLNKDKGMIIGIICHSRVAVFNDPIHEPYDTWKLKLHSPKSGNGAAEIMCEWADVIAFAEKEKFVRDVSDSKDNNAKKVNRAIDRKQRWLHLEGSPAFTAGNRYNLPAKLPLDWNEFYAAFAGEPEAQAAE